MQGGKRKVERSEGSARPACADYLLGKVVFGASSYFHSNTHWKWESESRNRGASLKYRYTGPAKSNVNLKYIFQRTASNDEDEIQRLTFWTFGVIVEPHKRKREKESTDGMGELLLQVGLLTGDKNQCVKSPGSNGNDLFTATMTRPKKRERRKVKGGRKHSVDVKLTCRN